MRKITRKEIIIVGAGASGLMCAYNIAGKCGVLVLDRNARAGRKLCASGGGRANFANAGLTCGDFVSSAGGCGDFCDIALSSFDTGKSVGLMESLGLPVERRGHGRFFLRCPAQRLTDALAAPLAGNICTGQDVSSVRRAEGGYHLVASSGREFFCHRLVLATGSPAAPALGGAAGGAALARALGHAVRPWRPALTPFVLPEASPLLRLAGISLPVRLEMDGMPPVADDMLFTHFGLSGPAALTASLYWRKGLQLRIDFLPGRNVGAMLDEAANARKTPRAILRGLLPEKLVAVLAGPECCRRQAGQLSRQARNLIADRVNAFSLAPYSLAGMKRAEACVGGVALGGIDRASMESLISPGLYILGELLDVAGPLGGYNLHWAFASGTLAARSLAGKRRGG